MFSGMKRRGLRPIVSRGPVVKERIDLGLLCGHTVTRTAKSIRTGATMALCPTCRAADGKKRDKDKADREEAAE